MRIETQRTDSSDLLFAALAHDLTAFLAELNGEKDSFYAQFNKSDSIPNVVVGFAEGRPVGCGAFRPMSEETVEIKRMYVDPEMRGLGIGKVVLMELEKWAAELGYATSVLETSRKLETAVAFYRGFGYEVIPNYEPYENVPESVCMQKSLTGASALSDSGSGR